jgi:two-component system, chemotaxis family, protein-glutamate methylesterase/glutaminase
MPSDPVRVLVVDDSALVRSTVAGVLSAEPGIEVVGTAADGQAALAAVDSLSPDVVTLDVDMPHVDGHEFLRRVRPRHPHLPVILLTHLTKRYAVATIEAMLQGAIDYVGKPSRTGSVDASRVYLKTELVPKILAFRSATKGSVKLAPPSMPRPVARPRGATPEIVVIGSSTGGPAANDEICRALPRSFALPIVVVQHMPPAFIADFAKRLTTRSVLPFVVAEHGHRVGAGRILIAPGDRHLSLRRDAATVTVELSDGPPVNGCRPAVDVLFKSAAYVYGGRALGVVLTGMGHDGLDGAKEIASGGGRIVVQDEASSVIWGMPGRIAKAGIADAIVPLREMAGEIALRSRQASRPPRGPAG